MNQIISISLYEDQLEAVEKAAASFGLSRSAFIRMATLKFIEGEKNAKAKSEN